MVLSLRLVTSCCAFSDVRLNVKMYIYFFFLQGTITCVQKNSSEAVPVKVVCHKMTSDGWKESESAGGDFKLLWEKVLQVVEHQMQFPPKTTRYQLNFNVLVQEVLRSCSHLFTADEKTFLGIHSPLISRTFCRFG